MYTHHSVIQNTARQPLLWTPEAKLKLAQIKHVALDLDGTIYKGCRLFPVTVPFLKTLDEQQISYSFVTNNSSKNTRDYIQHLSNLGISARAEQIVISTHAAIRHLRRTPALRKLSIIGSDSMMDEFQQAGFECVLGDDEPDAVVVGFDPKLRFEQLCKGAWWIKAGKLYLATHPDRICPTDEQTLLVDCGALCAALKAATGREPDLVLGKPDPSMLDTILEAHQIAPEQLAMVGDRLYTDIAMAHRVNALGVLVLSGETTREEVSRMQAPPPIVVQDIGVLSDLILEARAAALV